MNKVVIIEIDNLDNVAIETLVQQSLSEGFTFIERMEKEFRSGENCFNQKGEVLLGAFSGKELIAIGGLNRDPYANDAATGRVRHLYVLTEWRKQGIGKALVEKIIEAAKSHFLLLRLRTFNDQAALFYIAIGFQETTGARTATHLISLDK